MDMTPIRGHRNPRVVETARLHKAQTRRERGQTLIEGPSLLAEAVSNRFKPEVVFGLSEDTSSVAVCDENDIEFVKVDQRGLERLAGTKNPRGPVAVISIPAGMRGGGRNMLVPWGVGDPGNIGTMIRTAAAFDWDFGYGPHTADPWSPKALRAGAGAHFRLTVSEVAGPREIEGEGYLSVATVARGGVDPVELKSGKYAVFVGDEAHGLPESIVAECNHVTTIPLPGGVESLNAATAAALVVYQLSR